MPEKYTIFPGNRYFMNYYKAIGSLKTTWIALG